MRTPHSFNSRPHKEVDAHPIRSDRRHASFNSRPHKEVDRIDIPTWQHRSLSIHDLTRRSTLLLIHVNVLCLLSIHDLTRRSTCCGLLPSFHLLLSIHDLTRRSTLLLIHVNVLCLLSIHDLTRRSTLVLRDVAGQLCPFNSRPHKEVDFLEDRTGRFQRPFNSRPHKEVDAKIIEELTSGFLSIHDLTRRSTEIRMVLIFPPLHFQFTTSQGGRL